jgi:hypothetical protein
VGTCVAVPQLGESCPDRICAAGTYCDMYSGECTALKSDGATCGNPYECIDVCVTVSAVCAASSRVDADRCMGDVHIF